MNKKIIIALGGNALQSGGSDGSAEDQLKTIKETVKRVADIIDLGYEVLVVHGNGPQVGRILIQQDAAKEETPPMPFDVCGAMSQGYIGYQLQQALKNELKTRGKELPVTSLVSQVIVDKDDDAFKNPTKPVGIFYTKEEAEKIEKEKGYDFKEDANRGYRRVVPSPIPIGIEEIDTVKKLLGNTIVIVAGGGGIPVVKEADNKLRGVEAVIDKDFAAEELAEEVDAQTLLILTEVEHCYINFAKENQEKLENVTVSEVDKYVKENHFAGGSMLPKVLAGVKFSKSKEGRTAIISSLDKAVLALEGKTGTRIVEG